MTERMTCEFYLVASAEGFEVSTDLDGAHEQYGDNVTSYGPRRTFKLSIIVPVDPQITEASAALPDDAAGGAFTLEVKPASE